jgi:hypothetical protein
MLVQLESLDVNSGETGVSDVRLPQPSDDEHYILFADIGALVDWEITSAGEKIGIGLDWLAAGATYSEIFIGLTTRTEVETKSVNVTPVWGSIPTLKWAYGHTIHSEQVIRLDQEAPLESVRVFMFDAFTGQTVFVSDTRLTVDGPGVHLGP